MNRLSYLQLIRGQHDGLLASLARALLWVFSVPFSLITLIRNCLFDWRLLKSTAVDVPVISIGNITTGGTGKTPLVAWIARWLSDSGLQVALVSRGYGSTNGEANDEALELERQLPHVPHLQNPNRVRAARAAITECGSNVIVLDDAFQHRRLSRDLDIVLVDATDPFGGGYLLPRGLLREPTRSLRRASLIGVTRVDQVGPQQLQLVLDRIGRQAPEVPLLQLQHRPKELVSASGERRELSSLAGQQVLAVSAIGNPAAFDRTIAEAGMIVAASREFPDHHRFERADIDQLADWVNSVPSAVAIVCTGKDLVKIQLEQLAGLPLWSLAMELDVVEGLPALEAYLQTIVLMTE